MFAVRRTNVTFSVAPFLVGRTFLTTPRRAAGRPNDGPAITDTNKVQAAGKRFWKTVGIVDHEDSILVTLDKRPLKTPEGAILAIPKSKRLLASLIANEWENQETIIKAHALPMTSLAARAIDGLTKYSHRCEVRDALLKYLDTDAIRYFEDYPPALVGLQERHWTPLLQWTRDEFNVHVEKLGSLFQNPQTAEAKKVFALVLDELDEWQLACVERAVYTSKSMIISLALLRGRLTVEEAALASQVEVDSQIQKWGEVEDTHDVDFHDVRRQLASAGCLIVNS